MKIIFYGTRDYDHLYFDVLAADPDYGCTIKFLAANLDPDTAQLAAGGDAVCAFVNSDCGAETLSVLAKAGIKLLLMRCAGYNNVDLAAAKANGITVMRAPVIGGADRATGIWVVRPSGPWLPLLLTAGAGLAAVAGLWKTRKK